MHSSTSSSNAPESKRCLVALAVGVGIAILINVVFGVFEIELPMKAATSQKELSFSINPGPPDRSASVIQLQMKLAVEKAKNCDILFSGDSSTLMGIQPVVVEEVLGVGCWNCGTIGWLGTEGHVAILRRLFERGVRPKLIAYGVVPEVFGFTESDLAQFGYRDAMRRTHIGEFSRLFRAPRMYESDPSYPMRDALANVIDSSIASVVGYDRIWLSALDTQSGRRLRDELLTNRGFLQEQYRWMTWLKSPEGISNAGRKGLTQLVELCGQYETALLVFINPRPRAPDTQRVNYGDFLESLRLFARENPSTRVLTVVREYQEDLFMTPNHLTANGAERNSRELAANIGRLELIPPR